MESKPQGFVLAGGGSRRMGTDKALLEVNGEPLLLRTVRTLRNHVESVTLLGPVNRYREFSIPTLEDEYPGQGPLAAMCTGLKNSRTDWSVFVACDLPFLDARLLVRLLTRLSENSAQAVIPTAANRPQVLCAAYRRSCLPVFERIIESPTPSILHSLPLLQVKDLLPEQPGDDAGWERTFWNVNTPEDWERSKAIIEVAR